MSRREIMLLAAGLIGAAVFLSAVFLDLPTLRLASKAVPVLALALWLLPLESPDKRWIFAGLLLSALGDLCLEISPRLFIAGLLAFLCAHLAYVAAFLGRTRTATLTRAIPVLAFGIVVFLWLRPHLGAMLLPVLAYVLVICTMMWRAWAQIGARGVATGVAWTAALGATSFGLSDTLVAWNRFVEPVLALQILLMLLYWAGQWGIAASAIRHSR